ncbi:MAG: hypothetical protein MNPFHGCM_00653 [Gemmatimonadaceae bacterium]|nr:hypothetical protein [Gemmatimonadaceae bacterium]
MTYTTLGRDTACSRWRIAHTASLALAVAMTYTNPLQAQLRATVILPGFRSPVNMDTLGRATPVAAPAGAVFAALVRAFDRLRLEPDVRDSASLAVGRLKLQALHSFMGAPLSRSVDCGTGTGLRGSRADFDRVHLAILATVRAVSDGASELKLAVGAGSQALGGTLNDQISCVSTGRIEERLQKLVDDDLARRRP